MAARNRPNLIIVTPIVGYADLRCGLAAGRGRAKNRPGQLARDTAVP
jgi:hypothetical protein